MGTSLSTVSVRGRDLSLTYPRREVPALSLADFSIPSGAVCWILGHNGSGKSSLGLAVAGMLPGIVPGKREGEIRVLGKDPSLLEPRIRVETCSYILQDPSSQLCTLTVRSEISLLLENRGEPSSVIEAATEGVLKEFGIEHLGGRDLLALSGGEKQLVALAASAVALPGVLVLDEPCSYLDTENRTRVLEFVRRLKEHNPELTLLIVEHRTDGLPRADLIFSVSDGTVRKILQPPAAWGIDFPKITGRTKSRGTPLLEIRDLTFHYSRSSAVRPILNKLNLELYKGEIAVLEGSNGSGKSTSAYGNRQGPDGFRRQKHLFRYS